MSIRSFMTGKLNLRSLKNLFLLLLCFALFTCRPFTKSDTSTISVREQKELKAEIKLIAHEDNKLFPCRIEKADIDHTSRRIAEASLDVVPFPHAVVTNFFSPKVYQCITFHLKAIRSQKILKKINPRMSPKEIEQAQRSYNDLNNPSHLEKLAETYRLSRGTRKFLQDFPSIMNSDVVRQLWLQKFSEQLSLRSPRFDMRKSQTFSRQLLTIDGSQYAIRPHTDTVDKLVTILAYLPDFMVNKSYLGTLLLQKKDPKHTLQLSGKQRAEWSDFDEVTRAPFEPNVALAFSACEESWHAVREVGKMKEPRISLQTFIMKKDMKEKERVGQCTKSW